MAKVLKAYCTTCDTVTEQNPTGSPNEATCLDCEVTSPITPNPILMEQIRKINSEIEAITGRILLLTERRGILERMLAPIEIDKTPRWRRSDVPLTCAECGKQTKHIFGETARCYPKCKTGKHKIGIEDVGDDLIAQILSDLLSDNNDDIEVIKQ